MNVTAAAQSSTTTQDTGSSGKVMSDMFMKLLVAQLKSQSPLDPVDPTQFIGQLTQMNSLSELIRIREAIETSLSAPTATMTGNSNSGGK